MWSWGVLERAGIIVFPAAESKCQRFFAGSLISKAVAAGKQSDDRKRMER